MIYFQPLDNLPPVQDSKKISDTVQAWGVRYGSVNEAHNHTTLAYIGLRPVDLLGQVGYLWLELVSEPTVAQLRSALHAFPAFISTLRPWSIYAYTDPAIRRNGRFVEYMGFRFAVAVDGYNFYEWKQDEH